MQLLSLLLLLALPVFNPMEGPQPNVPTNPGTPENYQVKLIPKIAAAKKLVAKESVRVKWCTKKVVTEKKVGRKIKKITKNVRIECGREHALAVLDVRMGKIKTLRVGAMTRGQVRQVGEFTVTRITENGVNSEYSVDNNDTDYKDWIVVALKTMVGDSSRRGKFKPAVYVPYSLGLNVPEIRDAGTRHLLKVIAVAYNKLERYGVPKLREVIPKETILALLLIEHMDPDEFTRRGAEYMITKVLTTVGANESDAYRYAVSPANARGLAQFIPSTYSDVVELYPRARLHKDFVKGMTEHLNAVMAQVCLADRDLNKLLNSEVLSTPNFQAHSMDKIRDCYIAAAYNGGPGRAILSCGADPALLWKEGSGLARQTVVYVAEFKAVYNYLFSDEPLE